MARGDIQWADTQLDSSQTKSLGGPRGVRAYPLGEASGCRVWLTQTEVRYQATASIVPYAFYDHAARQSYADETSESIAGAGIGVRYTQAGWSLDAAMAAQTSGDAASEDEQKDPRFWLSARYSF
ncbi:ShlB/FhaC/HecB family hemolysin secretion/activation protein [Halopseudomonas salegens]|uniref:ShlB/FhaC/HecB family hemolysin secretion/activation protein n=1 Tax=Halopseudomonas salegens TaxID=1434072 RepID=UPI000AF74EF4|nr:ShlB/FhaC/HecB family hemolysin secretion/activation protein [Halopseudomonas salegens]